MQIKVDIGKQTEMQYRLKGEILENLQSLKKNLSRLFSTKMSYLFDST